jgi:3-hexulose-6-phosphate synthase
MTGTDSPPLLQLAVDVLRTEQALAILGQVHPHVDIVEVGTPLIFEEGLAAVEALKSKYPGKSYLADLKIMDAGNIEASSAFRRGADIVTVLALADDATIRGALEAAQKHGGRLMADLINVPDPAARAVELERMGVPLVCVHTAYDRQQGGANPFAELEAVRKAVRCRVAVAGGIKFETVAQAVTAGTDILVIGGGILNRPDPAEAAARIRARMQETKR